MTSVVDTSVKFFRDDFPGAPACNGVRGSFIALAEACLCTGFGLRSVITLVVSGGIATLTLGNDAKNPNLLDSVILVAGASVAALNGEQRVTAAGLSELKFATVAADGPVTGAVTVKTAPAGWEKKFPGADTAAFKSLDPMALTSYLWVNDAGTLHANVRAYEKMTAADTGTGPAPTVAESADGGYWGKSSAANTTANRWDLFADSRALYYCPIPASGGSPSQIGQSSYFFGDEVPYKTSDAFAVALFAALTPPGTNVAPGSVFVGGQGGAQGLCRLLRSYMGIGSAVAAFARPFSGTPSGTSGIDTMQGTFPAPTDGGLRVSKIYSTEVAEIGITAVLRGDMPGAYYAPQTGVAAYFQRGDTVAMGGKKLYAVHAGASLGGRGFIDITGPWR